MKYLLGALFSLLFTFVALAANVNLSWSPSTDNIAVTGYNIYRNGVKIGTSPSTSYVDTTTNPSTTYSYTITAFDAAGNESGQSVAALVTTPAGTVAGANTPGPSVALFNSPYYSCTRNFYVATTGSDTNTGTIGAPWQTIAHAETAALTGGDCVNVAPGTYTQINANGTKGGTSASANGYLVYRCTTPAFVSGTGCIITGTGLYNGYGAGHFRSEAYPNYLVFDGFNMVTTSQGVANQVAFACSGPGSFGATQTTSLGCHHWIIINNLISGWGLAGVGNGDTEYWHVSHNTITQNAHQGCNGFYGSGIGLVVAKPVAGYTRTADDNNSTNNPVLNLMGIQGPNYPFSYTVAWNDVHNNYQGCVGAAGSGGQTDGNGIIIDTFSKATCNANQINYPGQTLVAFNVAYNNGGANIHVFASANVTVANNTSFNGFIDPNQSAWDRGSGDVLCGVASDGTGTPTLWLNNISYSRPNGQACPGSPAEYLGAMAPYVIGGDATHVNATYNAPGRNISFSLGTACHADASGNVTYAPGPAWSCTTNKCNTNPLWANVGAASAGDMTAPPNGRNFALQASSPAIGYGATQTFLPAQSVDVGACSHTLTSCP